MALAAFFRAMYEELRTTWRSAGDFFLPPEPKPPGQVIPARRVPAFLDPVPPGVRASLEAVLPPAVQKEMKLETDEWVDELVRLLRDAGDELRQDVELRTDRLRGGATGCSS